MATKFATRSFTSRPGPRAFKKEELGAFTIGTVYIQFFGGYARFGDACHLVVGQWATREQSR